MSAASDHIDNDDYREPPPQEYLGDGLYVNHDGFQYQLFTPDNACVFLDPHVTQAFLRYIERVENVKITVAKNE